MGGHKTINQAGFDFIADHETWIIDPYVVISSTINSNGKDFVTLINQGVVGDQYTSLYFSGDDALIDNRAGATLASQQDGIFTGSGGSRTTVENRGTIIGVTGYGIDIYLQAKNSVINNQAGGLINGGTAGIRTVSQDGGTTINNHGTVAGGTAGVWLGTVAIGSRINNTGKITGQSAGIFVGSNSDGAVIDNHGLIKSAGIAVQFDTTTSSLLTIVHNRAGATISGATSLFTNNAGHIHLDNHGGIFGSIHFYAYQGNVDDVITNTGRINGAIFLGDGSDTFNGAGGSSGKILGEAGNDILKGGAQKDIIVGGPGRDFMTGGGKRDVFDFDDPSETGATPTTRDRINDFKHGLDVIDLKTIDTNGGGPGDGMFHFRAAKGAPFTGVVGQLRWFQENHPGTAHDVTIIAGDMNGDKVTDFQIELKGLVSLNVHDFIL